MLPSRQSCAGLALWLQLPRRIASKHHRYRGQLYVEPDRRAEFLRVMREQGSVTGFESEIYRKDRSRVWISENTRAIFDPQGVVQVYEGFVQDITDV